MRLNFAQIENMMRQADKMGKPTRKGVLGSLVAENEAKEAREAHQAMLDSLAMTFTPPPKK